MDLLDHLVDLAAFYIDFHNNLGQNIISDFD